MPVEHDFQSGRGDNGDAGAIQPSHWNATHVVTGMLAILDQLAPTPNVFVTLDGSNELQLVPKATYATILSPAFTGVPTAPTADPAVNSTQIATMAAIHATIDALIGGAPGALDTLNELAAAINDDASYAAAVTAALAVRLRVDAAQGLTAPQQAQGVSNLGLHAVAVSGAYGDLSGKPTLGTAAYNAEDDFLRFVSQTKTAAEQALAKSNIAVAAVGQCILTKVSANLVLAPLNGNFLTVNGVQCTVPDAGVSLAPTGATPNTTYYIYAVATAGVITSLEFSATTPALSTTAGNKGVKIKTGDDTRTLVGQARAITGPAWVDTVTQRFVRSYFNRTAAEVRGVFTANRTTTSTSFAEINTEIRVEFLSWADEPVALATVGSARNSAAGTNVMITAISVDSTSGSNGASFFSASIADYVPMPCQYVATLTEGYHYATVTGKVGTAGTAEWLVLAGSTVFTLTGLIGGRL